MSDNQAVCIAGIISNAPQIRCYQSNECECQFAFDVAAGRLSRVQALSV